MVNLDATRRHGIDENMSGANPVNPRGMPKIDNQSMTAADVPYADRTVALFPYPPRPETENPPPGRPPYVQATRYAHAPLTDVQTLFDFFRTNRARVERIIRPPFGRFRELDETLTPSPNQRLRDPRVPRDTLNDMRMPPYTRDSDENPLSITYRQYSALMRLIDLLSNSNLRSPLARRIAHLAERLHMPRNV
jgi:hypothetical protein